MGFSAKSVWFLIICVALARAVVAVADVSVAYITVVGEPKNDDSWLGNDASVHLEKIGRKIGINNK